MKLSQETITVIGSAIGITGIIITAMFFFFDNINDRIDKSDSRLTGQIQALDSRLTGEIQMLRQENKAIRADIQTLSDDVAVLKGKMETVLQLRVSSNDQPVANGLPAQSAAASR